jgi:hypothetical protein
LRGPLPAVAIVVTCALALACTELRSSPPDGIGGSVGVGGRGGAATSGVAGSGGAAGSGVAGGGGRGGGVAGSGVAGMGGMGGRVCDDSLIGWWRLNDGSGPTVADDSTSAACVRNNQTGALVAGATWTTGHEGSAIAFDGTSGVIGVQPFDGSPPSPLWLFPAAPMTMTAWIRPDAAGVAAARATAVARTHEDYAFQDFWLGLVNGNPRCTIHNEYGDGPTALGKVAANTWTHLACTYGLDGAISVYVNGTLAATGNTNQVLGPIETRILIGASEIQPADVLVVLDYFSGVIDDVRLWNRQLSTTEVRAVWQQ